MDHDWKTYSIGKPIAGDDEGLDIDHLVSLAKNLMFDLIKHLRLLIFISFHAVIAVDNYW